MIEESKSAKNQFKCIVSGSTVEKDRLSTKRNKKINNARRLLWSGNTSELKRYLEASGETELTDYDKGTLLHDAAIAKEHEIVKYLLEAGANPNTRTTQGQTPLHYAAMGYYNGGGEIAHTLIQAGAELNARCECNWTALHFAAMYNLADAAETLLDAGADRHVVSEEGLTPLQIAIEQCHTEIEALLRTREKIDQARDNLRERNQNDAKRKRIQKIRHSIGPRP